MSVAVSNVIVSQDLEALNNFLRGLESGTPMKNLVDQFNSSTGENKLLFSSYNNPNFISFEHVTMDSEIESTLEFIDPKNEFEEVFLNSGSVYDDMANFIKEANLPSGKITKELLGGAVSRVFFVAFGLSDKATSWSPAQRMFLSNVQLDPKLGRKITLKLVSLPKPLGKDRRLGAYNELIDLDSLGLEIDCDGYSDKINVLDHYLSGEILYGRKDVDPLIDLHALVVDTVYDYLRKATNGSNVIVLLPDINKICSDGIEAAKKDANSKFLRPYNPKIYQVENTLSWIKKFLNRINMFLDIKTPDKEGIDVRTESFASKTRFRGDIAEAGESLYKTSLYRARMSSYKEENIPDLRKPLTDLVKGINNQATNNYKINPVLFSEADTRITDGVWSLLNVKSINNKNKWKENSPTVIFGDTNMIIDILYSQKEKNTSAPLYKGTKEDLDKSYKFRVASIFERDEDDLTPLGRASQVPDQFGYTDKLFDEANKTTIREKKIPIFTYNTDDPNILDINYSDEGQYFTLLNNSFQRNVGRIATTAADGGVPLRIRDHLILTKAALEAAIITSKDSAFGTVLSNDEIIGQVIRRVSPELLREISPRESVADLLPYITDLVTSIDSSKSLSVKLRSEIRTHPTAILQNFADNLAQQVKTITIKTLPFFHLSCRGITLQSPCIVFAQDVPVLAQQRQPRTRFNNFLSGLYNIVGFRHKINTKEAQSEFVLIGADIGPRNNIKPGGVKEEVDEGKETHKLIPKLSASPPAPSDPSKRNS
tara:strand:- start:458 stop:2764 length:2307 start_codon:yes stop_codon:yes gene_type:complete